MKTDLMALVESKRAWLTALASAYIQTAQEFGAKVSDFQITMLQTAAIVALIVSDALRPMERKSKPGNGVPPVTPPAALGLLLCCLLVLPGCFREPSPPLDAAPAASHATPIATTAAQSIGPRETPTIVVAPPESKARATFAPPAKSLSWLVIASDFSPVAVEARDDWALFGVERGKRYLIAATALTDDGLASAQTFYAADGPGPMPPPPNPNPPAPDPVLPDGRYKLARAAYEWTNQVPAAQRSEAAAVASHFSAVASAIGAGALADFDSSIAELRRRMQAHKAGWAEWSKLYSARIGELYDAGELASVADFAAALEEIAVGLREVKA